MSRLVSKEEHKYYELRRTVITAALVLLSVWAYQQCGSEAEASSNYELRQVQALEQIAKSLKKCHR